MAAGVPAPPSHRHHRRGPRRVPARVGRVGATDRHRRHRAAGVRVAERGDARLRHGVRRGLNAGLHAGAPELDRLGIEPEPWEPWTPLAIFHSQQILFGSVPNKLWHSRARAVLGADEALLSRDPAYGSGSNAWAVGGRRTTSGKPLIGGDPHRLFESPGVYAQVRLAVEGDDRLDVFGFTFPGVPGVQHFAHAGEVAWAITNAVADYQDVLEVSLDDVVDAREEAVEVRGADPVTIEFLETGSGPLFEVDRDRGVGLALRDAATVLGDLGFEALLPLLRARSLDDVDRAMDAWVVPVNNVVIADRSGAVRFRYAGRVPVRAADGTWSGWVELPHHDVPPDGQVVTANERRGSESDLLGDEFAPPHRAARIHQLLRGVDDLAVDDFEQLHGDSFAITALPLSAMLKRISPSPSGLPVRDAILAWDGVMAAGSAGAAAFAAWRNALTIRIAAEPVFDPLRDDQVHGPLFAPYLNLEGTIGLALEPLSDHAKPFGIEIHELARLALEDVAAGSGFPAAEWGETHVFAPTHAFDLADADLVAPPVPAVPVSGDTDTVRCTGWVPGVTDVAYRGSTARYVWDLDDPAGSRWVVPMGASGDPRSPHHVDQLAAWAEARLLPIELDWDRLTLEDWSQALLEPRLRVGVVVVALDVAVARALVHRDRLGEGAVGVQPDRVVAEVGGDLLEVAQQPRPEPGAAPAGVDPHPLDLAHAGTDLLDPAARDRLAVAGGHHERPRARRHVLLVVVVARVEAGGEARVELVEVAAARPAAPGGPGGPSGGRRWPPGPAGRPSPAPRSAAPAGAPSAAPPAAARAPRTGRRAGGGRRGPWRSAGPYAGGGPRRPGRPARGRPPPGGAAGAPAGRSRGRVGPAGRAPSPRPRRSRRPTAPSPAAARDRGTTRPARRSAGCRCG